MDDATMQQPTTKQIFAIVCDMFGVDRQTARVGKTPKAKEVRATFVCAAHSYGHTDFAISVEIGLERSTIAYHRKKAVAAYAVDTVFQSRVGAVKARVSPSSGEIGTVVDVAVIRSKSRDDEPREAVSVSLPVTQIDEARRLRKQGWSYKSLAKRYQIDLKQAALLVGDRPESAGWGY